MTAIKQKPDSAPQTGRLNQSGFTLLEILVSIAIMALVMVSVFRLQSSNITLTQAGRFAGAMPLLAERQLSLLLPKIAKGDAPFSGNISHGGQIYQWTCQIETIPFESPIDISENQWRVFKKIHLKITDASKTRTYAVTVWRYLVEPNG